MGRRGGSSGRQSTSSRLSFGPSHKLKTLDLKILIKGKSKLVWEMDSASRRASERPSWNQHDSRAECIVEDMGACQYNCGHELR